MFPAPLNHVLSGRAMPPLRVDDDYEPLPPRFSLLALFGVSTGAAVYCGLLRLLGVYAVMLMLAGLIGLYVVQVPEQWRATKRMASDMLAGIVLPIGCLMFDPGVFRSSVLNGSFSFAEQIGIYVLLGSEMLVLFVWLLVGGALNHFSRSMTAGMLMLGSLICIALGLVLTLVGLPALVLFREPIGLLGLVPWFTLLAFGRNAQRAKIPSRSSPASAVGMLLGVALLLALAAACGYAALAMAPSAQSLPAAKIGAWK